MPPPDVEVEHCAPVCPVLAHVAGHVLELEVDAVVVDLESLLLGRSERAELALPRTDLLVKVFQVKLQNEREAVLILE